MISIFLDIETSGLDPYKHRVLEIAFKIVNAFTGEVMSSYQSIVNHPRNIWDDRDLMSIEINGFTRQKMETGRTENEVRDDIINIFSAAGIQRGNAVFICQNPAFDRGFFSQIVDVYTQESCNWPYHWLDLASMHWALTIKNNPQSLETNLTEFHLSKNAIAKYFHLSEETVPHSAINGVNHLIDCYEKVVGFL